MIEVTAVALLLISIMIPGWIISGWLTLTVLNQLVSRLAWSFLLGSSFMTVMLMLSRWTGVQNKLTYGLGWLIAVALLVVINGRINKELRVYRLGHLSRYAWIWLLISLALICFSLLLALTNPVIAYDSLFVWSFRAKLWFYQQSVEQQSILNFGSWHNNYPWQISLLQYCLSLWLGYFSDTLVNLLSWFYYLTIAGLLYGQLRIWCSVERSLFWVAFYLSLPLVFVHSYQSYADLALSAYVLGAFIALEAYWHSAKLRDALIGSALLGLGFLVKLDALIISLASLGLMVLIRQMNWAKVKYSDIFKMIIVWILTASPWLAYLLYHNLGISNVAGSWQWQPEAVLALAWSLGVSLNWHLLWFVCLASLLAHWKLIIKDKNLWLSWLSLALVLAVLVLLYVFTNVGYFAINQTATSRNLLLIAPIAVLVIAKTWARVELDQRG